MTEHVSLPVAQWLKEQGFPQDGTHFRWYWWDTDHPLTAAFAAMQPPYVACHRGSGSEEWYPGTAPALERLGVRWCAAPHPLAALRWLAKEKEYDWNGTGSPLSESETWIIWFPDPNDDEVTGDSPNAALEALVAAQEVK